MDAMKDILSTARERMKVARNAEDLHHRRAAEDLNFLTGPGQWPEAERAQREAEGRPVLTFNLMTQAVERVKSQIRDMNPAIKVKAADSAADPDIAEIIEGLVRHIEYNSEAASVYEAAGESAASCSMGYFRVRSCYAEGDTFNQELKIERVYNPFSSFPDPMAKHPTRRDAEYWFLIEELSLEEFKEEYPKAETSAFDSANRPAEFANWTSGEKITVAEYYWIEDEEYTIGLLQDGSIVRDPKPPLHPVKTRKVCEPRVKWAKLSGAEVLEGPLDVPGRYIPVIAVTGSEYHMGEETYRSSVIRHAKDAQVAYNITRTSSIEVILSQPRAPWLVTTNQVAGLETFWNEAHKTNRPYLPYIPDPDAPMPQRSAAPMASQGLMAEAMTASEDVKRTTGIYDASLGNASNETSGVAIKARQQQSEAGNSVYADNLVKAVEQCGRVLVGMIPQVYDAKQTIRILGEDGQEKMVTINDIMIGQDGVVPVNDLTIGRYDVRIAVGPSYDTKREEGATGIMELARIIPQVGEVGADLIAKAQNFPDADRLAERLRKLLPPGVAEQPEKMTPEEQQAQMQADQQAQQQAQMQQSAVETEMRLKAAQAQKAEAEAMKAQAEAQKTQIEAAQLSGQIASDMQSVAQHAALGAVMSE